MCRHAQAEVMEHIRKIALLGTAFGFIIFGITELPAFANSDERNNGGDQLNAITEECIDQNSINLPVTFQNNANRNIVAKVDIKNVDSGQKTTQTINQRLDDQGRASLNLVDLKENARYTIKVRIKRSGEDKFSGKTQTFEIRTRGNGDCNNNSNNNGNNNFNENDSGTSATNVSSNENSDMQWYWNWYHRSQAEVQARRERINSGNNYWDYDRSNTDASDQQWYWNWYNNSQEELRKKRENSNNWDNNNWNNNFNNESDWDDQNNRWNDSDWWQNDNENEKDAHARESEHEYDRDKR